MFIFSKQPYFTHTHEVSQAEPKWSLVDASKLPLQCFAVIGDEEDAATWLFPHHFIEGASMPDEHGRFTRGQMLVHVDGLKKATEAAKGNEAAMRHLESHWKTIDPDSDGHPLPDRTGLRSYFEERSVPRYSFSAPAVMSFGSNGDDSVSAPVSLIALSGEILDRPEWGPCIQDLSGLEHRDKVAIDYRHNGDEVIGYINQFMVADGKLVLSGALVPQKTHNRTQEIIDNIKAGVPYEASVYFPPWKPDEMEIEYIDPGENAMVNGKIVTAPDKGLTIFRKWSLRGVAICPHGADGNTAAYLQTSQSAAVNIRVARTTQNKQEDSRMKKEQVMELLGGISKETDAAKFMQALTQIAEKAEDAAQKKVAVDSLAAINGEKDAAKKSALASASLKQFGFEVEVEVEDEVAGDKEDDKEDKVESYSLEDIKKFGKAFGARAHEYMGKGFKYEKALESDHALLTKQAAEAEAAKVEQKARQSGRTRIKFQNTDSDSADGKFGLSEKEVIAIEQYAQEFGLSDKARQRIIEKHAWAKRESNRLGIYTPDPKAVPFNSGSSTLTKVGNE